HEAADGVAAKGKRDAPLEAALRQLEPVDAGVAKLRRKRALAGDDEHAVLDHRLDIVRIDAGKRDQDQELVLGFEHVDRRLPAGFLTAELLAQPFAAGQLVQGLGQHPVEGIFGLHGKTRGRAPRLENEDMVMTPANSSTARLEHAWLLDGEEPLPRATKTLRRQMFLAKAGSSRHGLRQHLAVALRSSQRQS